MKNHIVKYIFVVIIFSLCAFNSAHSQNKTSLIPYQYDGSDIMSIGLYGYIDNTKTFVIMPKFSKAVSFCEGLAYVEYFDSTTYPCCPNRGFIDEKGNLMIKLPSGPDAYKDEFEPSCYCDPDCKNSDPEGKFCFKNGFFKVCSMVTYGSGKYGFINKKGELIVPTIYQEAHEFSEGLALVKGSGSPEGYVDTSGKLIIPLNDYVDAFDFKGGVAKVSIDGLKVRKTNPQYGYINKLGEVVVPFIYESLGDFSDGVAWFRRQDTIGFVDLKGKEVIPAQKFDKVFLFSEGLARVMKAGGFTENVTQKYGNEYQKEQRSYDTYGYIDKKGNLVIPCKYTQADGFKNGKAKVFTPGSVTSEFIDKTGKTIGLTK